jgi:hypothetical protein
MTSERIGRLSIVEAQIARQREMIARLEARGEATAEAKSALSGMQYSLKLFKLHQKRDRSGARDPHRWAARARLAHEAP